MIDMIDMIDMLRPNDLGRAGISAQEHRPKNIAVEKQKANCDSLLAP